MNRFKRLMGRLVLILLAFMYLMFGIFKLQVDAQAAALSIYGYPLWAQWLIGIAEMAGGAGLLFSRTARYAAMLLSVIMVGAVFTHGTHGELSIMLTPLALLLLLLWILLKGKRPVADQHS